MDDKHECCEVMKGPVATVLVAAEFIFLVGFIMVPE
jgi:hypothetical protein